MHKSLPRFLSRPRVGDHGCPGRLTNTRLILFPFSFFLFLSFSMHFPVIWRPLALPYMLPRQLEAGVSPRLITLKTMIAAANICAYSMSNHVY
jgi:hypothetical protein